MSHAEIPLLERYAADLEGKAASAKDRYLASYLLELASDARVRIGVLAAAVIALCALSVGG